MTRMSKPERRRARCPKKRKAPFPKSGSKKDNLPVGYRVHESALTGDLANQVYIPKLS
jgi:hypothetical protein